MVKFKKESDRPDFDALHPRLREIVNFMSWYTQEILGRDLTVTRIVEHDGTTHDQKAPFRFIDIRSNDFPKGEAEKLRKIINKLFIYDVNRPSLLTIPPLDHSATSPTATAEHFHVQVKA